MWQVTVPHDRMTSRHRPSRRPTSYRPLCTPLEARCLLSGSLTGNGGSASPVGAPVVWTAKASGHGATPVYQFRVGPVGGEAHVVRDFSPSNSFTWDPLQEGRYIVQVIVKDSF